RVVQERFKQPLENSGAHAYSRVLHLDKDFVFHAPATKRQGTSLGHGIDGVKNEVGKDLAQFSRTSCGRRRCVQLELEGNGGALRPAQPLPFVTGEFDVLAEQLIDIDCLEHRDVTASAGKV